MRRAILIALVGSLLATTFFACAEDSPILVVGPDAGPDGTTPGPDGQTPPDDSGGTPPDSGGPSDAGNQPDVRLFDGGDPDALITRDAGQQVDAAGCMDCDCDNDGFDRPGCGNDAGLDCDDNDSRYRPNQSFVIDKPESGKTGDWDCRNGVEKLFPTNVTCGLLTLSGCAGAEGFNGDPGCGEEATYVRCTPAILGLLCTIGSSETKKQACR
jgi:hypothetical protein